MSLSIWREKIDKNGVHRYISKQAFRISISYSEGVQRGVKA